MKGSIERIEANSKVVYIIDYSDCKESEMIDLVIRLKHQIVEGGQSVVILSTFNDGCFATPKFMRHVEEETREALHLIEKQAIVGLSETKKLILKGYNFLFRKNILVFDSKEAALEFLLDDNTSDSVSDIYK